MARFSVAKPAAQPANQVIDSISLGNIPAAQFVSGKTYFGAVGTSGNVYAAWIEPDGTFQRYTAGTTIGDDHCQPSLSVSDSNPPFICWTKHDDESVLRYRVGNTIGDITDWGAETTLAFPAGVTYSQVYRGRVAGGGTDATLHLFTRSGDNTWYYRKSTNNGSTWAAAQQLVDFGQQGYLKTAYFQNASDHDAVRVAFFHNSTGTNNKIWYGEFDLISGDITAPGIGSVGNLDGTGLPLDPDTDLHIAYNPGATRAFTVYDVAGEGSSVPVLLIPNWLVADNVVSYQTLTWNGSSFNDPVTIAAAGTKFALQPGRDHGRACFPRPYSNTVWISRNGSSGQVVERYTTTDGTSWTLAETAPQPSTGRAIRPICPENASDYRVLYCAADYYGRSLSDTTPYTFYSSRIVGVQ